MKWVQNRKGRNQQKNTDNTFEEFSLRERKVKAITKQGSRDMCIMIRQIQQKINYNGIKESRDGRITLEWAEAVKFHVQVDKLLLEVEVICLLQHQRRKITGARLSINGQMY